MTSVAGADCIECILLLMLYFHCDSVGFDAAGCIFIAYGAGITAGSRIHTADSVADICPSRIAITKSTGIISRRVIAGAHSTAEIAGRCVLIAQSTGKGPRSVIVDAESAGGMNPTPCSKHRKHWHIRCSLRWNDPRRCRNRAGRSPVLIADRRSGKSLRLVIIADRVSIMPLAVLL